MESNDIISREMALGAMLGSMAGTGYQSLAMGVIRMLPALEPGEVMGAQWVSVKDRLPDLGTNVLVFVPQYHPHNMRHARYSINGRWQKVHGELVTHWMPMPMPPEEESC